MKGCEIKVISVVVPCFNEEEVIEKFYWSFFEVSHQIDNECFELIFIDDGSIDKSLKVIKKLCMITTNVRYLSFTRNFGKEAAIFAGLEFAQGEYIVVMDIDLQDPPQLMTKMYEIIIEGEYDCIATYRINREGESPIRSFFAKQFYKIINKIGDVQLVQGARDYRMMTKKMVQSILSVREYNRFSKGIFNWVGYRTKWLGYYNQERILGTTKWSFWGLFKYAIDGIVAFSTAPLVISCIMGIILFCIACVLVIVIIFKTILFGDPVQGWPSLACLICFVSGVQLLSMGILGQYLAKTYMEIKRRPLYLIKEMGCSEDIEDEINEENSYVR